MTFSDISKWSSVFSREKRRSKGSLSVLHIGRDRRLWELERNLMFMFWKYQISNCCTEMFSQLFWDTGEERNNSFRIRKIKRLQLSWLYTWEVGVFYNKSNLRRFRWHDKLARDLALVSSALGRSRCRRRVRLYQGLCVVQAGQVLLSVHYWNIPLPHRGRTSSDLRRTS